MFKMRRLSLKIMIMKKRRLGNSDLQTAPIIFGGNVFGWTVNKEQSLEYNTTPAAVSLNWLLNKPMVTAPIASATKLKHIESFDEAVNLDLSKESMDKLEKASRW